MSDYKDLKVWQSAMNLSEEIYKLVKLLPVEEKFALSDQMRRAAVSIPSNIAEGSGKGSSKDFLRFIRISQGSRREIETQLLICVRVGYLTEQEISKALSLCEETGRLMTGLIRKLESSS